MANRIIQTDTLTDIADAIRAKTGKSAQMTPAEMVTEIGSIRTGTTPTGTKQISITQNGTTTEDVSSYASAQITVNVPQGITPSGTKQITITENGTKTEDVSNYADAQISVNVPSSSDIATALQALGFTIVSDTIITGTRTSGNTSTVFADTGASTANGQGLIVVALDAPTMNQAVIRLEGNSDSTSCAVRRYTNDLKHGTGTNVNGFLQDGIRYRAIIYTP